MSIPRRQLLQSIALAGLGTLVHPLGAQVAGLPKGAPRLVWVLLRGGLDGLSAVVPVGDPDYAASRPDLPLAPERLHRLDATFALHHAMDNSARLYDAGELGVIHAVSSPYRRRSHFDAQKVLENGTATPAERSGWLNRALPHLQGQALALGPSVPLVLQGEMTAANWAPPWLGGADADLLQRLALLYSEDAALGASLDKALAQRAMAGGSGDDARSPGGFSRLCQQAASFMTGGAVQCVTLDFSGWDTHSSQGANDGRLARQLGELDRGIEQLRRGLGVDWKDTVVVIASEFGRTVAYNGSAGTDHGTGGLMLLAGGALRRAGLPGGSVAGDWPGLAPGQRYEGRDLFPANDSFYWLGQVLERHMALEPRLIREQVLL